MIKKFINSEKLRLPWAFLMLAISLFCTFLTLEILLMLFEHGSGSIMHVTFISALLAINGFAVYLNFIRIFYQLKEKFGTDD